MSDMRMYNILGVMKGLNDNAKETQLNESVKQETVYENVEPRGSIMDAVKSLGEKYLGFKKLAEAAKPDFLDVDKDGDKKEPFKKAVKDKKAVEEGTIAKPKKDLKKHSATAKRMAMQKKADKGHEEWLDSLEKTDPDHPSLKYRKQATNEGAGPYTLDDPKHPKFKANYEKYKKAHPDCTLAEFVAAMRKKEKGLAEAAYDEPAAPDAEAIAKRKRLQAIKDRQEEQGDDYSDTKSNVRKVAGKAYGGAAQKDDEEKDLDEAGYSAKKARAGKDIGKLGKNFAKIAKDAAKRYGSKERGEKVAGAVLAKLRANESEGCVDEVAPPGTKAERMVKHIKKGYAKDGKLTKKEKGIAYATAWKAKKAGQVEEGVQFGDKIANSKAEMKKAKPAMVKESRVMEETDYFYEKVAKSLCEKNPHLDTAGSEFVDAVRKEMVAQGIQPNRARNILTMDEDFLGDVATSYGHYCKEVAECGVPMNSFLGGTEELDEIAKLAGLPVRETEVYNEVNREEPLDNMDEDAMGAAMGGVAGALVGKSPQAAATGAKIGSALRDTVTETHGLTINGKEVNVDSIEVDGVYDWDSPDFADAYITYAEFSDGTPLSDDEVDQLTSEHGDLVNQAAHGSLQGRADFVDEVTAPPRATPGKAPSARATGMSPAKGNVPPTPTFNEDDVAEGNEFSGALAAAKASGKKEFEVDGKKYTVKEGQVNEDATITVSATLEDDAINMLRKLAGMQQDEVQSATTDVSAAPVAQEFGLEEERDIEYTNTPNEKIAPVGAAIPSGTDLNRSKKQYKKEYPGDNPMAVKEEALWKSYENMIKDIKA